MEENPTRICELLVGLGDVEVLGVDDAPGGPLGVHIGTRARPACGCGCRILCRGWSGGISVLVDESTTAGRFHGLEVPVWLVWWVGGDGWSLIE